MFGVFIMVIGLIFTAKEIFAEKSERKIYNTCFDWNEYWKDVRCGVTTEQQIEKRRNGGYTTTLCFSNPRKNDFDHARYEHDKTLYGEAVAEMWKQNGSYKLYK